MQFLQYGKRKRMSFTLTRANYANSAIFTFYFFEEVSMLSLKKFNMFSRYLTSDFVSQL